MRDENTGKKAATIAGRIMRKLAKWPAADRVRTSEFIVCTIGELRILAASALTQAPDKSKKS
jgi:hypothetical protein